MWWKIYFWTYAILTLIGIIFQYGSQPAWSVPDFLEVALGIILSVGMYNYIYKKKILEAQVWNGIFILLVINFCLEILYKFTSFTFLSSIVESRMVTSGQDLLLGIVITIPALYAVYALSTGEKKSVKKGKKS